jgi:hypothetical protein
MATEPGPPALRTATMLTRIRGEPNFENPSSASAYTTMIAGNPRTGRKLATVVAALFIAIVLVSVFAAMRKRTAPLQEPPLHPSTVLSVILPLC